MGKVNQLLSDIERRSQAKQGEGSTAAQKGSSFLGKIGGVQGQ